MTNFEYIRAMTEEDFANFMIETSLNNCWCKAKGICSKYNSCFDAFVAWLKSERIED